MHTNAHFPAIKPNVVQFSNNIQSFGADNPVPLSASAASMYWLVSTALGNLLIQTHTRKSIANTALYWDVSQHKN